MTVVTDATSPRVRAARAIVPGVLKAVLASLVLAALPARALVYDFLLVTTNPTSGKFTSPNGNGFITVTTAGSFPMSFNNSNYFSAFTNLFKPSGTVPGYITQYDNSSTNTTTFDLTNYALSPNTVFGIWNMTEEPNTYSLKAYAGSTQISPPFTWNLLGYDDDSLSGNIGWVHLVLNPATGIVSTNIFKAPGTDSDGAFWTNIPPNTTKIVVSGILATNGRDGVVYYFAEPRPPCQIICPTNITVFICGPPGTNVTFPLPTLYGDCATNGIVSCDPSSGSFFHLGTNTVHCTVPGYSNYCDFTVTVLKSDPIPPKITCPSDITVLTCGTNAVVNYSVTASDNSGTVTTNCSPPSGSAFPLGTNAVGCIAIDGCSNTATCSFNVIVKQIPVVWGFTCNESIAINATGCPPVMPVLTNIITVTNTCPVPGGLTITQAPPAGTVLTPGPNNPVTITVCATNGTCQVCQYNVNAFYSPGCCTIACPTNITVTTCGTNAVATFPTPVLSGPCASTVTVFCSPPSGSLFPLGTNTVLCTATNGAGATVVSCSFPVVVVASASANTYDFLSVSIIGSGGKFTSPNGNGFITVTNTGGPFLSYNNTVWSSQFTNLFLASGTVQGWIAQADNYANYTNTFYLTNYNLSASTVFGIWNITEEPNAYSIKLLDGSNTQLAPPFTWNFMGYDDDALAGNIGWYHMVLNPSTGFLSPTNFKAFGVDCDAAFWTNLPPNTRKIVVTGNLGPANADGVVFYFAERAPCAHLTCPANMTVGTCGTNAVVNYPTPIVTGAAASSVTLVCTPPIGSTFPLGTTTVNCIVTNAAAGLLLDSCSFTVTVVTALQSFCNPVLTAKLTGTNVLVSWPDTANGFTLQETGGLAPPIDWATVNEPVTAVNGTFQVTIPVRRQASFYRLSAHR